MPRVNGLRIAVGYAGASGAQENPVTAIDIALEPDATMIQHAKAANALLLKVFPEGLRCWMHTHHPHITMLQQFVRTAPTSTRSTPPPARSWPARSLPEWKLKAFKYYYIPWKAHSALAGIVVEPTDGSALRLQQRTDRRSCSFHGENRGPPAAFVTTTDGPRDQPANL